MDAVRPEYSGASVTSLVPSLLGGRPAPWMPEPVTGARGTVLLVLDGLGWDALRRYADRLPELAALTGERAKTVVPSTTASALTSITTGLPPSRHAITGFRVRVDGSVLNVLRWQQANGRRAPEPDAFQRQSPFLGRPVPVVTRAEFRTTGFTGAHLRGGVFHGWPTPSALVQHCRALAAAGERFVYAYYPGIDEIAHHFGLDDHFYPAELEAADRLVGALLDVLPGDYALVVTADHGQVHVGPEGWVGLGPLDPLVDAYAGDGRFRHLHARAGASGELESEARRLHGHHAWVLTRDELLDDGWLGPDPVAATRRRVGDVVLAARAPVAFVDPTLPYETKLVSAHGSLTAAEMEVPVVAGRGRG